jgi:hypothetical protein
VSREELLLVVVAVLFSLVAWFLNRLVVSIDEFKLWVRKELEEHDTAIVTMKERHRLEDIVGTLPRSHQRG